MERTENYYLLVIRDMTNLINFQKNQSDNMYLDAIEANYSHEQMTPLNCIIAQSNIIYKRFKEII